MRRYVLTWTKKTTKIASMTEMFLALIIAILFTGGVFVFGASVRLGALCLTLTCTFTIYLDVTYSPRECTIVLLAIWPWRDLPVVPLSTWP